MKKYNGFRYIYFIIPTAKDNNHIVNIHVYLYEDENFKEKQTYIKDYKFNQYIPSEIDLIKLDPIIKEYISKLLNAKYKNIVELKPRKTNYIWEIPKIIKKKGTISHGKKKKN